MFAAKKDESTLLMLLRWAARLTATAALTLVLLFVFGEGSGTQAVYPDQLIGLLFFPLGLFVGLILAWQEELWGGLIATGSILGFYVVYGLLLNGSINQGWWFLIFGIPGVLFIIYGLLSQYVRSVAARHA